MGNGAGQSRGETTAHRPPAELGVFAPPGPGTPPGGAARPERYLQPRSADMPPPRGPPDGERAPARSSRCSRPPAAEAPPGRGGCRRRARRGTAPAAGRCGGAARPGLPAPLASPPLPSPRPPGGGAPRPHSPARGGRGLRRDASPPPAALPLTAASSSSSGGSAGPGEAGRSGAGAGPPQPAGSPGGTRGTEGECHTRATAGKSPTPSAVGVFTPYFK